MCIFKVTHAIVYLSYRLNITSLHKKAFTYEEKKKFQITVSLSHVFMFSDIKSEGYKNASQRK